MLTSSKILFTVCTCNKIITETYYLNKSLQYPMKYFTPFLIYSK